MQSKSLIEIFSDARSRRLAMFSQKDIIQKDRPRLAKLLKQYPGQAWLLSSTQPKQGNKYLGLIKLLLVDGMKSFIIIEDDPARPRSDMGDECSELFTKISLPAESAEVFRMAMNLYTADEADKAAANALAAMRKRQNGGRPRKYDAELARQIMERHAAGESIRKIAIGLGLPYTPVYQMAMGKGTPKETD